MTLVTTLLLSACAPSPSTNGCAWTKPITLDDDAFLIFVQNEHELRGLTDQINSHNDTRKKICGR